MASSVVQVRRPVWRRFDARFEDRAVAWVRDGGHAVLVGADGRLRLLLPLEPQRAELPLLAHWVLLTLGHERWTRPRRGPLHGLGVVVVRRAHERTVLGWCERDSAFPGPTRRLRLDCLRCGACCQEADVQLGEADLLRWDEAAKPELRARVRVGEDGKLRLPMTTEGRCALLGTDLHCAIYTLRPDNCRAFPVGSEACLSARLETLGLDDGHARAAPW